MISLVTRWWCHDESRLELDLWRHWVGCHLYNCGWFDELSPSLPPYQMSTGHTSSSVPPSSSSSGDSYFYPARSSPIMINSQSCWPGWPSAPPRVTMTPDPESSSPEARSHLDWDPRAEVPTKVGDEIHGRYVDRFPSDCLRELIGIFRMHLSLNDRVPSLSDRSYFGVNELQWGHFWFAFWAQTKMSSRSFVDERMFDENGIWKVGLSPFLCL